VVGGGIMGSAAAYSLARRGEGHDVTLIDETARARPGRLRALSVSRSKSVLCGAFVSARRALSRQNGGFRPGQHPIRSSWGQERAARTAYDEDLLDEGGGVILLCHLRNL
jgi:hypothetical protein